MLDNEWEALAKLLKPATGDEGTSGPETLAGPVGRLHALHRISRAATRSLDLEEMLSTVAKVLRETIRADRCAIFLYDQSTGTLTLRSADGINTEPPGSVTLPLGVGITGQAALTRQLQAVPDATSHPAYLDYPHVNDRPFASQVSVPLISRSPGGLLGVLNIMSLERRVFLPEELDFLETAAGEISIAIENAQLYSETDAELRRRIAQLELLQQLWRAIASTLDLPALLELISTKAIDLSGARAALIYRQPRARRGQLELLAQHPSDWMAQIGAEFDPALRPLVGEVLESCWAIWRPLSGSTESVAVYAMPMITGRRAVGAICLVFDANAGQPAQPGLLHAFTDTAAIAIENAELYDEARRGLARASALLQEMHHRVRNNLQTVAALLSLQMRHASPQVRAPLQEAVSRIRSLTVVHDLFSGKHLQEMDLETLCRTVVEEAVATLCGEDSGVTWTVEADEVWVSSRQATILALLLNEFVANAVRHGFKDRSGGRIHVLVRREAGQALLEVADDGWGLPPGFDARYSRGLGLQIARTLVEVDLRGRLEVSPRSGNGTVVRIWFSPDALPNGRGTGEGQLDPAERGRR